MQFGKNIRQIYFFFINPSITVRISKRMIFTPGFLTDICNKNNKAGLSVTAFAD